jgi:hypothetical protein
MSVRATLARNVRDWGDANFTFVHTDLPAEFWEHAYRLISGDRSMAPFDTAEQIDLSLADGFDTVTFVVPQENRWLLSQLEASFPGGRPVAIEVEFHDPEDVALAYRIDATSR